MIRILERLELDPGLPVGRVAGMRRLLARGLPEPPHALVIGPALILRPVFPRARLDVVGTDPGEADVTVVSTADGPTTLPKRWELVVVTDTEASAGRLNAALQACVPGGVVAILRRKGDPLTFDHERELDLLPPLLGRRHRLDRVRVAG